MGGQHRDKEPADIGQGQVLTSEGAANPGADFETAAGSGGPAGTPWGEAWHLSQVSSSLRETGPLGGFWAREHIPVSATVSSEHV